MSYTKGPWTIEGYKDDGFVDIGHDQEIICGLDSRYCEYSDNWFDNAKLISVAPELLEALEGYMMAVETFDAAMEDGCNVQGAISGLLGWKDNAKETIAKAKGET